MKNRNSKTLLLAILLIAPAPAFAYLDPGTGSAVLQGILGGVAALGVILKLYWHRILKLLGIRKNLPTATAVEERKEQD